MALWGLVYVSFYSMSALLAMQTAVLAKSFLSVRPSVRPSFCHVPVLCPDEWRYDRVARALKWSTHLSLVKIWPIIGHNFKKVQDRRKVTINH